MSIRVTIVGEFDFRQIQQAQRELDAAARQLETFGTRVRRAGEQFGKAGRQMQTVGRNLTKYVTLPIVGPGPPALKSSISFESAFADVTKTVVRSGPPNPGQDDCGAGTAMLVTIWRAGSTRAAM